MKKLLLTALFLGFAWPVMSQQVVLPCYKVGQTSCQQVSATSPLPVTGTFTPSGQQNVNLNQVNGATPSLTNPLWVSPATGATFPVSGTVTTTPSGTQTVSGAVTATGNVASGAADSGNPLKIGGIYNTALPTFGNLQRGDVQLDNNGRVRTNAAGGTYVTLQVSVGTTATQVSPGSVASVQARITNLGTTDVFCGPSGVTITTGELLLGAKGSSLIFPTQSAIFCVVGTGTQTVSLALF